jgi:hypothetical protein
VHEAVLVEEGAIEPERRPGLAAQLVFTDERPLERAGTGLDELVKGRPDRAFVTRPDVGELRQREAIIADGRAGRLQGGRGRHGEESTVCRGVLADPGERGHA